MSRTDHESRGLLFTSLATVVFVGLLAFGPGCPRPISNAVCGNGICEAGETVACSDCAGPVCGNGMCETGENVNNCAADCGGTVCGNGVCEAGENVGNCAADCGGSVCGNGACEMGEDASNCPGDCGGVVCGDGICEGAETNATCPGDCPLTMVCGDGVCSGTETNATCPADCMDTCGNGICALTENDISCSADCGCQGGANCAATAPGGCECDAGCVTRGDCCTDACTVCGSCSAATTDLLIINSSAQLVWSVYISPCGSATWGVDQLGGNTIPSGTMFTLTGIPPGCYDLRAEVMGAALFWEQFANTFVAGVTFSWTLTN